jgi:transposase
VQVGGGAGGDNVVIFRQGSANPVSQYEALKDQREELGNQLERLRDRRNDITRELTNSETRGIDRAGLEAQLQGIDARIVEMDKATFAADAALAQAAAVPGAVAGLRDQERARRQQEQQGAIPEEAFVVGTIFMFIVFLPMSIAYARRIWRRSATAVASIPAELMERMSRVEQGVESIAIEVERIGEGQRFMTRVFTESNARSLGAGAAEPIRQAAKEGAPSHARSSEPGR